MISKYLNPKNDIAFRHIFGQEKSEDILIALLNATLKGFIHKPIKKVTFINTFQIPEVEARKQSVIDVLCYDQDSCQYIIEMQVNAQKGFEKRAQYYAAKAYISQMRKGGDYENLKTVIFIAFTDYIQFKNVKRYKTKHKIRAEDGESYLDSLNFVFIELPKFAQQCKGSSVADLTLEEKFYYFLDKAPEMNKEELKALVADYPVLDRALELLERFNWTEKELMAYEKQAKIDKDNRAILAAAKEKGEEEGIERGRREGEKIGEERGRKEGRKEGREEGRKEGEKIGEEKSKREVAKRLIQQGKMTLHEISEVTGIPYNWVMNNELKES